ncbi:MULTISPECIES: response regulator [unclassified Aeromonas]|uniref:response regulator n=1 Tax=unclassified Aeromonas TaxID=257493 RepID=UPI001C4700E5|nr:MULTISPECIES: response regulator [unclassified Aeromonas]MBV7437621.1 response regulator [Aeromonas sp. sif2416]MBV7597946.1 response regulator [Aeromonas sp. sia0103]
MIITDEELLALLESDVSLEPGFHPVSIYALDAASHQAVQAAGVPEYASLHRTQPEPGWQWEALFAAGAIALFEPAAHAGASYLPRLMTRGQGIYQLSDPWLVGLQEREQGWRDWLARLQVLLLEDHPFQGACIQQEIQALGLPCQWVQDGDACLRALEQGEVRLLICDLSLAEQDAISLLMSHPQYQHSGLPIILLSAHDQTLIDGARRLLHDAGFNVLAALAKPLQSDDLLRLLKTLYLGPQRQRRLSGLKRTIRSWNGEVRGQLGLLADAASSSLPIWLAVSGLPPHWEQLKTWLEQHGRLAGELTLVIHRRDQLLSKADRFALVLQASLAGARLALLLDSIQHLPFDKLERLPLQHLLLGQHLLPELEAMATDSLLDRFIGRARELGIAIYIDDPFNLLDASPWQDRGIMGRW